MTPVARIFLVICFALSVAICTLCLCHLLLCFVAGTTLVAPEALVGSVGGGAMAAGLFSILIEDN
jgi:hypothetical protein